MSAKRASLSIRGRLTFWSVLVYAVVTVAALTAVFAVTHHHVHGRDGKMLRRILADLTGEYAEFGGLTPAFRHCLEEDVEEHNPNKTRIEVLAPDGASLYATKPLQHEDNPQRQERVDLADGNRIVITYDINDSVDFGYFLASLLAIIGMACIVVVGVFSHALGGRILRLNQLVETKDRAIAELKTLTDDIAHDLRTPLTRLNMAAEAALAQDRNAELAEQVAQGTEAMVEMINTMLEISQTGFRIDRTPREELDLAELVRRSGEIYQSLAEDQGLRLSLDVPAGAVPYSAHKAKLQQVLGNLLDNALKFTPRGGEITLSLVERPQGVVLAVRDTGVGIAPEDLPHVFRRFYRADASRNLPGNGLGLALVEAIVTSYGGRIACRSTPGAGTTFEVSLPAQPR